MSGDERVWVKICGTTSVEDARLAEDAGADAVGFVFAKSPRQVTAEQVAEIIAHLRQDLEKIGVFVDASLEEICTTVRSCGLTGVQLHSNVGNDVPARLREELGMGIRILRVVHYGAEAAGQIAMYANDPSVDAVLVDSRTATAVGGTGQRFDWTEAQSVFAGSGRKLIVAGGLNPENVGEALDSLRPHGVDVVTGVEAAPGKKDPAKVKAFVARVRER